MILAPLDVVRVLEEVGLEPPAAAVGRLDVLGALVERPELGVMGHRHAADFEAGEELPAAGLGRLLDLRRLGGSRGGRGGGGGLDGRAERRLGVGDVLLELQPLLDVARLLDERSEFGVLLRRALGEVGQFPHPLRDRGGAVLESLEVLRHRPAPC